MLARRMVALTTLIALAPLLAGCPADEPPPEERPADPVPAEPPPEEPAPAPPAPEDLPPGVTEQMVEEGRVLFAGPAACHACHAADATGTDLGPDLTDATWIHLQRGDLVEIETVIRTGVATPVEYPTVMPPMGGVSLTDEQVEAISAYIFALNR